MKLKETAKLKENAKLKDATMLKELDRNYEIKGERM